jgi:Flp pilus assembly protein TadD
MLAEAAAELAALPSALAATDDALLLRLRLHREREDWTALREVAATLAHRRPQEAGHWIIWAYAARRAESLEVAERILTEARALHPTEPTVLFNLGCYACQRGDLALARSLVDRAIALEASFRELAGTDPDLAPLRAAGA